MSSSFHAIITTASTVHAKSQASGNDSELKILNFSTQNDDEWKSYEDEKKDYTGLKIETLKVTDNNDDADDGIEHEINEETGEKVPIRKDDGGPWKKLNNTNRDGNASPAGTAY